MYYPTLPVPREIEEIILQSTDPSALISYIMTNTDIYQRALDPIFWRQFDHYFFQEAFYLAARYRSHELLESMLWNPYQIIDRRLVKEIQALLAEVNDRIGLDIVTQYLGNSEIYEINLSRELDQLVQLIKNRGPLDKVEKRFTQLFNYYLPAFISRALIRRLTIDQYEHIFKGSSDDSLFPSLLAIELAGSLAYYRRYDELRQVMWDEIDRINRVYESRGSDEYSEGVPFLVQILKYADYDFYQTLYNVGSSRRGYSVDYDEMHLIDDFEFISDPKLYEHLLEVMKDQPEVYERLLASGVALDPYEWIEIISRHELELLDVLNGSYDIIDIALYYGFDYYSSVIENSTEG